MKKILLVFPIVLMLVVLGAAIHKNATPDDEGGINFIKGDMEEARLQAKKSEKYIFVDTYADWCRPCKMMDKKVFTDEKVVDYFKDHYVAVKMNGEKGNGPDFMKKHGVRAYPTFIIMNTSGKVIHRFAGYQSADKLLSEVKKATPDK